MLKNWFKKKSTQLADEIQEEVGSSSEPSILETEQEEESWLKKLSSGLSRTRTGWVQAIGSMFSDGAITEEKLEEFEELLIAGDMGVQVSMDLVDKLREKSKSGELKTAEQVESFLKHIVEEELKDDISALKINEKPFSVIVMVGINGVGKTTTIAKMTHLFQKLNKKCLLVAADTFRAGAVEQLKVWSERLGDVPVVSGKEGQDPASVAFDGIRKAKELGVDVVLIDTAGRLHTQTNLMEEVKKIIRVVKKNVPDAPHETLMVLDSTIGQNAIMQARTFHEAVELSGFVVTKLDGTAKGGIVVAIHRELRLPVRFIGVGEKFGDLQYFNPKEYSEALFG
jgi:fused signal recognition particle receptor